jgi:methylated-DNA-[protein]-cysteine S-methyltransferase
MTTNATPKLGPRDEWVVFDTPVGKMMAVGDDDALRYLQLPGSFDVTNLPLDRAGTPAALAEMLNQVEAYFDHRLHTFSLPLDPAGTEFQRRVWWALADIPYGGTESYGQLAARIGSPAACRAVGAANGRNPIPLVLPCHRVIGSSGSLTGYGGGIELKQRLLHHERAAVTA